MFLREGRGPGVRLRTKLLSVSVYRRQRQRPRPTSARRTRRQAQAWQAAPELQSEARKALTAVRNCISRDCQVNTPADRGGCGCRDREAACAQHFSEYVPGRYLHRGRLQIVAISSADDGVQFRGSETVYWRQPAAPIHFLRGMSPEKDRRRLRNPAKRAGKQRGCVLDATRASSAAKEGAGGWQTEPGCSPLPIGSRTNTAGCGVIVTRFSLIQKLRER